MTNELLIWDEVLKCFCKVIVEYDKDEIRICHSMEWDIFLTPIQSDNAIVYTDEMTLDGWGNELNLIHNWNTNER